MTKLNADTAALFLCCLALYPERVARVAAEALFWSQHGRHNFRGRRGIYKSDKELSDAIGKHPKTVGRLLMSLCSRHGETGEKVLFEVEYGPKPKACWGRVRWLFRTPAGNALIAKAIEFRKRESQQKAAKTSNKMLLTDTSTSSNQSPQYVPTNSQTYDLKKLTEGLSPAVSEKTAQAFQAVQEQVKRVVETWNKVCENSHAKTQWLPKEVERNAADLGEVVVQTDINKISDQELMSRLTVLCCSFDFIKSKMSEAFREHNKGGLRCKSFALYGAELMALAKNNMPSQSKKTAAALFGHPAGQQHQT